MRGEAAKRQESFIKDQTDPTVAKAAGTQANARSSGDLHLLGTMHGPSTGRALLRHDGKVHVLEVGETLGGATVTAVGEGVVTLDRRGRTERLHLPSS